MTKGGFGLLMWDRIALRKSAWFLYYNPPILDGLNAKETENSPTQTIAQNHPAHRPKA
jgi:hypothetical protein